MQSTHALGGFWREPFDGAYLLELFAVSRLKLNSILPPRRNRQLKRLNFVVSRAKHRHFHFSVSLVNWKLSSLTEWSLNLRIIRVSKQTGFVTKACFCFPSQFQHRIPGTWSRRSPASLIAIMIVIKMVWRTALHHRHLFTPRRTINVVFSNSLICTNTQSSLKTL